MREIRGYLRLARWLDIALGLMVMVAPLAVINGVSLHSYGAYSYLGAGAVFVLSDLPPLLRLSALVFAVPWLALLPAATQVHPDLTLCQYVAYGLGFGCVSAVGMGLVTATSRDAPARRAALASVCLFPLVTVLGLLGRQTFVERSAPTYDLAMLLIGERLGGEPSFPLARWLYAHQLANAAVNELYLALPAALGLLYALLRRVINPLRLVALLTLGGVIGAALYHVTPVAGPRYAIPSFPFEVPPLTSDAVHLLPLPSNVERNGMPSLHLAMAMIVWWGVRQESRIGGWATGLFLLGTILATLGLGEHYVIDLVVGVPLASLLYALFLARTPARHRIGTIVLGLTLTALWIVGLRTSLVRELPSWMLGCAVALTIAAALSRMLRRVRPPPLVALGSTRPYPATAAGLPAEP